MDANLKRIETPGSAKAPQAPPATSTAFVVGTQPRPGRVLVVDDEAALLAALRRFLRGQGYTVEVAANGEQAIAHLKAGGFDVVLTDIRMPGMDGTQLLQHIRARDPDLPVVLLTGSPTLETAIQAVSLHATHYLTKPVDLDELSRVVGASLGMRRFAELRREAATLLKRNPDLVADRLDLEKRFDSALQKTWIALQPVVKWSDKSVYAHEALVRSTEPTLADPGSLFRAAEQLGRAKDIGKVVRKKVAALLDEQPPTPVLVNVHPEDFLDESLYDAEAPLSKHAYHVTLEITERSAIDHIPELRERVRRLRSLGYKIAVDDIGAGYAGLASFALLEPDLVKLDMLFARELHRRPLQQRLVRSIVTLCKELDVEVIAEGVETADERDALINLGCDLLQGYLFARPAAGFPAPKFDAEAA